MFQFDYPIWLTLGISAILLIGGWKIQYSSFINDKLDLVIGNFTVIPVWQEWLRQFQPEYSSEVEKAYRFSVFMRNLEIITNHNQRNQTYTLGLTQFADMSSEQFLGLYATGAPKAQTHEQFMKNPKNHQPFQKNKSANAAPGVNIDVNWVDQKMVMPVGNMGKCQSSYAFTSVSAMYSLYLIQANFNVTASVEQVLQCSTDFGNQGCNGGTILNSFNYMSAHKLCMATAYPYTSASGVTGVCNKTVVDQCGQHQIGGYDYIPGDCDYILNNLQSTPVAVEIVPGENFQLFKGGLYLAKDCQGNFNTMAMLLVGVSSPFYWILQGSLGTYWADQGYMQLQYGNSCEVCFAALQPNF